MAANRIFIQVDLTDKGADAAIVKLNQDIAKLGPTSQKVTSQADRDMQKLASSAQSMQRAFGAALSGLGSLGLQQIGGNLLEVAASFDKLERSLQSTVKTGTDMTALMRDLRELSAEKGLPLQATVEAMVRLLPAFNRDIGITREIMSQFANTLALTGGSAEDFTESMRQVGQMLGLGKVTAENLNQVMERIGPRFREAMDKAFGGKTTEQIQKMGVTSKEFVLRVTLAMRELERAQPGLQTQISKTSAGFTELKIEVGKSLAELIPFDFIIRKLQQATQIWKDLPDWSKQSALGLSAMATAIGAVSAAVWALNTSLGALATNPIVLALLATGAGIAYKWQLFADALEEIAIYSKQIQEKGLIKGAQAAQAEFDARYLKRPPAPKPPPMAYEVEDPTIRRIREMLAELEKARAGDEKAAKKYASQVEQAQQHLESVRASELEGIAALEQKYAHFFREVRGNAKATALYRQALEEEAAAYTAKLWKEHLKSQREANAQFLEDFAEHQRRLLALRIENFRKLQEIADETRRVEFERQRQAVDQERDLRQAQLELEIARTEDLEELRGRRRLDRELEINRRRFEIERDFILKRWELEQDTLERARDQRIAEAKKVAIGLPLPERTKMEDAARKASELLYETELARASEAVKAEIELIDLEKEKEKIRIWQEYLREVFHTIKNAMSDVFDILVSDSKTKLLDIANYFKKLILDYIRDIITSAAAKALMKLLGFQLPTSAAEVTREAAELQAKAAGIMAGAGGTQLLAATIMRQAGAQMMAAATMMAGAGGGGGGGTSSLISSFVTPKGGQGGGLGTPGTLDRLKDFIGLGKGGLGAGKAAGMGTFGKIATSDAAALAGAALIYGGAKRGGWSGTGMMTAGGALVGAKIGLMVGGPLGAAIGAGIGAAAGFTAGLIRMSIKSAEQKAAEKIERLYGVRITDKNILRQIVEIAKQNFGGNLDVAVYSPQVRELVQLYAMATGQSSRGMPREMHPVTLAQSAGGLSVMPVYSGGNRVPSPYVGPTPAQWAANPPQPVGIPGVTPVTVSLDKQKTAELFVQGVTTAVANNPQAVSDANMKATRSGYNRNGNRFALQEPMTTMM